MATKFEIEVKVAGGWEKVPLKDGGYTDKAPAVIMAEGLADLRKSQTRVKKVVTKIAWTSKEPAKP